MSPMTTRWQLESGKFFADTVAPMENPSYLPAQFQIAQDKSLHLGIRTCAALALNTSRVRSERASSGISDYPFHFPVPLSLPRLVSIK